MEQGAVTVAREIPGCRHRQRMLTTARAQLRVHQRRVRPDCRTVLPTRTTATLGDVAPGERYRGLLRLICPALAHRAILGGARLPSGRLCARAESMD
jgi:hypothetical protein